MNTFQKIENKLFELGIDYLAGVDEAGRGPLAGPVVAAAVIFPKDVFIEGINDSKKLKSSEREELYDIIKKKSITFGIGVVDNDEIERTNILVASLKAMTIAVESLSFYPDFILVDGNHCLSSFRNCASVIKGDSKCFSIGAASILAKVYRDELMFKYSMDYPLYKFYKNKGYPTKEHINLIKEFGPTPIHRKTFLKKLYARQSVQEKFQF